MYALRVATRAVGRVAATGTLQPTRAAVGLVRLPLRGVVTSIPKARGRDQDLEISAKGQGGEVRMQAAAAGIADVTMKHDESMLKLSWSTGGTDTYPYVWLRDNCQCPLCFHSGSRSRVHLIEDLDLNARPRSAKVLGGQAVEVQWTDGHVSRYEASWLLPRAFQSAENYIRKPSYKLTPHPWGSELMEDLPRASFPEMMSDDAALLKWSQQLEIFGFVMVSGAPAEPGQVRRLAERIAFIKKTHYGEDFTVIVKDDPSNVAYLSGPLQLHADLPYYQYKPGVQFIHCIKQYEGNGGDSQVTDGLHAANLLRENHPQKYRILTSTPVDWFDEGSDEVGEFLKILQLPMICTDSYGDVCRINFSQPQRDSFFDIPAEDVAAWYDAMKTFHRLLADPKNCLHFKMTPGTIMTFDNLRILHGRTAYLSGYSARHIEGCYVDWDEVRSRRHVLEKKLGVNSRRLVRREE